MDLDVYKRQALHDAVSICRNVIDTVNKVKQTQAELTFTTELEEMCIRDRMGRSP